MTARNFKDAFDPVQPNREVKAQILAMAGETGAKRDRRRLVYRIAAVAALLAVVLTAVLWPAPRDSGIVTAPGVLKAYACELATTADEEWKEHELTGDEFLWRAVWSTTKDDILYDTPFGRPITLQVPEGYFGEAKITFQVSSDCDGFCKETQLANGEAFYLGKQLDTATKHNIWKNAGGKDIYMDVLVLADGKIAGYGIISFYMDKDNGYCYAYRCESYCFPMENGKLQDVDASYVQQKIAEYKQDRDPNEGAAFFEELHGKK